MNPGRKRANEGHYLTFSLVGELYAIPIRRVREIIEYETVRPVPGTPPYVRGVINLRGAVVPVIDLALKFDLDETPVTRETCIIILDFIVEGESSAMGVLTEAVSEVLDVKGEDIEPPPVFGTQVHVDYLLGMSMIEGDMVLVLDIDEVLHASKLASALDGEPGDGPDDGDFEVDSAEELSESEEEEETFSDEEVSKNERSQVGVKEASREAADEPPDSTPLEAVGALSVDADSSPGAKEHDKGADEKAGGSPEEAPTEKIEDEGPRSKEAPKPPSGKAPKKRGGDKRSSSVKRRTKSQTQRKSSTKEPETGNGDDADTSGGERK